MRGQLTCTCDAHGCDRRLGESECMLVYRTEVGERRAYQCDCGAVTMTVHREQDA